MTLHRFFATGLVPAEGELPLSSADVHHVRDVLRLKAGDEIVVAGERALVVRLTDVAEVLSGAVVRELAKTPLPRVTLAQGLAKGEKIDDIVRQATEIGVARVIVFSSGRSVVRLDGAKGEARAARWNRVAVGAAGQSQRSGLPEIVGPVPFQELVHLLRDSAVLVCWEDSTGAPGIGEAIRSLAPAADRDVAVVVGPEGGLAEAEVAALAEAGGVEVSLGPTILRTETAGVVAAALAIYERGGLGGDRD